MEDFGSMTKPYHAGHAARNGVLAALLAREGLTASESALDGKQGFLEATGTAPVPAAALATALDGLGQRWHVLETGVAVKPYPSCALTHSAIDALLDLRTRHDERAHPPRADDRARAEVLDAVLCGRGRRRRPRRPRLVRAPDPRARGFADGARDDGRRSRAARSHGAARVEPRDRAAP